MQEAVVAVTRVKKTGKATLLALSGAALTLPGIDVEAATPVAEPKATTQYGHYEEEGDRMKADVYHGDFILPLTDWFEFTFSFDQDTYVGATPYFSTPDGASDAISAASNVDPFSLGVSVIVENDDVKEGVRNDIRNRVIPPTNLNTETFRRLINSTTLDYSKPVQVIAAHPLESRNMPVLGGNFYWGPVTLGLSGGYSLEDDFDSTFGSSNLSWELNNKLTTLTAGFSLANNDITREAVRAGGPHDHSTGELEDFEATSKYRTFDLGFSQILTKNTLFHLNGSYIRQRGYLSNPYKLVNITGEITPEEYNEAAFGSGGSGSTWDAFTDLEVAGFELFREVRPEKRDIWVIATGLNQHIPSLDASVQFDYRFFMDNWDISSHTFELAWYQDLPYGISVTPNIRYYSQSSADFFAPFFRAPRSDGNYSSDYRLSDYGALSGGISVNKEFTKGFNLNVGFEYRTHKGSLKLGGGGEDSYADIDSYLISAALEVNLSSLGRSTGHESHHDKHAQHGGHLPAGVMFGHMLSQANEFMIGYNYSHGDWSDGYQNGTSENISDQELISKACDGGDCEFKAERMRMDMHMINFMYAPTDWLNLMIMPQFAFKKMEMEPLPNSIVTDGGYHDNTGLGDTLFGALVKIFDTDGHHMHMGAIFSAPTGRIDVTFDGFINSESQLQSFGMQLGSGTWDFKPSLTYTGSNGNWSWGAQAAGIMRMESSNKLGYVLGDEVQGSLWGGYKALDWLSFSVRNIYKSQGKIKGNVNRIIPVPFGQTAQLTTLENPANKGGQFWDLGIGVNFSVPGGEFAGHSLSVEWLQPVIHDVNGYQLEQEGTLAVHWGYAF